jgi:hypothetical protein
MPFGASWAYGRKFEEATSVKVAYNALASCLEWLLAYPACSLRDTQKGCLQTASVLTLAQLEVLCDEEMIYKSLIVSAFEISVNLLVWVAAGCH